MSKKKETWFAGWFDAIMIEPSLLKDSCPTEELTALIHEVKSKSPEYQRGFRMGLLERNEFLKNMSNVHETNRTKKK